MMPARDEGYVYDYDDPRTWRMFRPLLLAHDVGHTRDRSTAVVGGNSPMPPRLLGISDLRELPQGLCGSPRASALAAVDREYGNNALIIADLSNDASYAEVLHRTFGRRVIGLQISRHGDGMQPEQRPVGSGSMLIYTVGRSYLLELFHAEFQSGVVKMVDGPMARRAYQQLADLETELRDSGTVYRCPSGKHDDLGISCAMLAWASRHPHLEHWVRTGAPRRPPKPRQDYGWAAFT
jgi:hypothetical protein